MLGILYYSGDEGFEKNYELAVEYLQDCADLQYLEAMFLLGECYYYGRGIRRDMEKAHLLWKGCAESGHHKALSKLRDCFPDA